MRFNEVDFPVYAKVSPFVSLVKSETTSQGWCVKATVTPQKGSESVVFKKGDVILEVDPLAICIGRSTSEAGGNICSGCCRPNDAERTLKRCSGCLIVYFCSYACQKRAWAAYHKYECRYWKKQGRIHVDRERIMQSFIVRLLTILLTRLKEGLSTDGELSTYAPENFGTTFSTDVSPDIIPLYDALTYTKEASNNSNHWFLRTLQLLCPREATEEHTRFDNAGEEAVSNLVKMIVYDQTLTSSASERVLATLRYLRVKLIRNCFSVFDAGLRTVGAGLYPYATFFNHTCLPNCTALFDQTRMVIVCRRDIFLGEELTIGYTRGTDTFENRHNTLLRQYGFQCSCAVCSPTSLFARSYNLGREEPLCKRCYSSFLSENQNETSLLPGTQDWFSSILERAARNFFKSRPGALNVNNSTLEPPTDVVLSTMPTQERQFIVSPCTMERRGPSSTLYRCRRCHHEEIFDIDALTTSFPQPLGYQQINQRLNLLLNGLLGASSLGLDFFRMIDGWPHTHPTTRPSDHLFSIILALISVANVERVRTFISGLTDACTVLHTPSCAPDVQHLEQRLLVLDVYLGQLAWGTDDLVVNLVKLRLAFLLWPEGNHIQALRAEQLIREVLERIGCYSRFFPILQHAEETYADLRKALSNAAL